MGVFFYCKHVGKFPIKDEAFRNFFRLLKIEGFQEAESILNDNEGLYKVVKETLQSDNNTKETFILRHTYGGIWRSCDEITGNISQLDNYFRITHRHIYLSFNPHLTNLKYGHREIYIHIHSGSDRSSNIFLNIPLLLSMISFLE